MNESKKLSRRQFLRGGALGAGAVVLAACGAAPTAAPTAGSTTAPAAPTLAPTVAPTAAPTAAAVATVAPTAASVAGRIPSPAPGVPDAYTRLPEPFVSVAEPPGRGGPVSVLHISYDPPLPGRGQSQFFDALEQRLNVQWNIDQVPAGSYGEKIAAVTAGGSINDLTFVDTGQAPDQYRAILQGAYADLTPYLTGAALEEFPHLAAFPAELWRNVAINGKIYGVPRPRFLANNAMYFRQDWASKVGFGQQQSADDVLAMLTAFAASDPDGNGSADTFGLSSSSPRPGFGVGQNGALAQMFRVPNTWRLNSDGSLVHMVETEEYRQSLDFARRLWVAGAFHPDAVNLTTPQNKDLFFAGKIGGYDDGVAGLLGTGGAYGRTRELNPDAAVGLWVPVGHDGGKAAYHKFIGFFGFAAISAQAGRDPERVKELLRILNYFAAPFGSEEWRFAAYGIEGVHHTLAADGRPTLTDLGKAERGTGTLTGLSNPPPVAYYDIPGNAEYMQQAQQQLLAIGVDNPTWGYYSPTFAAKSAELAQLEADRRLEIVTGRAELSSWDSFVADWRSRGGDQIRTEYQQAIAAG